MVLGLVGEKVGMTRLFSETGVSTPVTVIAVRDNRVTQVKRVATDGYDAVQVASGSRKPSRVTKPMAGHFAKANSEPGVALTEFRLDAPAADDLVPGTKLGVERLSEGQKVDAVATSIGKGFAGVVKRHGFRTQDATHGNSLSHRAPGSIGQNQSPGRVFKGKRMAGQLGNVRRTTQNLEVVKVDAERQLVLVKGSVPGARGARVLLLPAVKAARNGEK